MSTFQGVRGGNESQSRLVPLDHLADTLPTGVALSPMYLSASRRLIPKDRWHIIVDKSEGQWYGREGRQESDGESDEEPNGRDMAAWEASSTFC